MMKSLVRFSAWIGFAALLCFAPCAFGQGAVNVRVARAGNSVLNYAPASLLAFTLGQRGDHRGGDKDGNGCGNQGGGGGGWDGEGRDDGRGDGGGGNGGDGCTPVPEGGTALMYLSLAGLCCLGAMVLRSRRQASVRETHN